MNSWIKSTLGISGAGLFIILATNLKELIAAIEAGWLFLGKLTTDAPLGLTSFMMALALATLGMGFVRRYLPKDNHQTAWSFMSDLTALAVGFSVVWVQMDNLSGFLLGVLAGLLAPLVYRFFAAIGDFGWKTMKAAMASQNKPEGKI